MNQHCPVSTSNVYEETFTSKFNFYCATEVSEAYLVLHSYKINKYKTILEYVIPVFGAIRIMSVLDSDDVLFSSIIIFPYITLKHKWYSVWGKRQMINIGSFRRILSLNFKKDKYNASIFCTESRNT